MPYEICVKSRQQRILLLTVEETDKIRDLKQDVKAKVEEDEPLYFNGLELADEEATLLEYNIVPDECPGGPVLHLGGCTTFDIECELPTGRQLKEHVTNDTTVAQLKGRITSEAGIPYLCMKLLDGNLELRDPVPLRHYGLAGRTVRVLTRQLYAGPAA
ncbi:RUB2 [Symbiodinium pilosum]|uniref:RUB2 protein n=1 Tax=Symbiodinium pilosum TaxID=2952 RepID=A0A812QIQ2_SYMPI|nr:RUB2 [Symbiodinium pilosum]